MYSNTYRRPDRWGRTEKDLLSKHINKGITSLFFRSRIRQTCSPVINIHATSRGRPEPNTPTNVGVKSWPLAHHSLRLTFSLYAGSQCICPAYQGCISQHGYSSQLLEKRILNMFPTQIQLCGISVAFIFILFYFILIDWINVLLTNI